MTHSHEDPIQEQLAAQHNAQLPVGSLAVKGANYDQNPDFEQIEDPLAGDVDRWVDPTETRSDEQVAHDESVANRLHMSGDDGADEYWADYDDYFGTVNGGQPTSETEQDTTPKTTIEFSKRTPGFMTVTTPKGRSFGMGSDSLDHEYFGMSHDEIGERLDVEEDEHEAYKLQQAEDDAEWDTLHPDPYGDQDEKIEDPLAGDVDRWVDPNETKDY
jgi:hypothetical protein